MHPVYQDLRIAMFSPFLAKMAPRPRHSTKDREVKERLLSRPSLIRFGIHQPQCSILLCGVIIDGSGDLCDDLESSRLIGGRIGHEYGDRKLPSIRQSNQPYVIGGRGYALVHV